VATSTTSTTSSSSSSTIFNGTSRYSSDFQAVIDRATAIASLPITQLNNQKSDLTDQSTALTGLDTKFAALQTALGQISDAVSGGSFSASVSDTSKVSATLGDGAVEGSYSIEVVDPGAYATSMTSSAWVAATGSAHTYTLSVGGVQYSVTPSDNSAASVASAINSQYGDKVRAIVLNVGSSDSPDYRISLQATTLGDLSPDLLDNGTSLQTQQTTGAEARYIVNGSGTEVSSTSRSVTIATGVTVNLLAASSDPVDITVTRSTSALSDALSAFATAYNAAVDEVDKQHGTSSGALAGQSLVNGLSQVLSQLSTYDSASTGMGGMAGLGLDLDKTGHLTFNSLTLLSSELTNSSGVTAFLGSATGGGFLQMATNALNSVEETGTGLLPAAEAAVTDESTRLDTMIADQQAVIDRMTEQLQTQMATADALIATMEQQYDYLTGLFSAQDTASKSYA
jgi:flagellar hook-associated protein 2